MTMSATFIYTYGGVRIEVAGMPPAPSANPNGLVVKRSVPTTGSPADRGPWTLESIRGFQDPSAWPGPGNTSGICYDFEMALGLRLHYFLVPVATKSAGLDSGFEFAEIVTPGNLAWLRDPYQPSLSQPVIVVSTDPKNRPNRQSVYNIVGRKNAQVVWDVRSARSGTVQLLIKNQTADLYRQTRRDKMDKLLDSGRPLLLSMCVSKGFDPCWMAITNATYNRWGAGPTWTLDLEYVEVDNPATLGVVVPPELRYEEAAQIPAAGATYADWKATFPTYFDLTTNDQGGQSGVGAPLAELEEAG